MKNHLKRLVAPKTWPITTKSNTFITRPAGSGSSLDLTIPVVVALKEMLKLATTTKEVKHILHSQEVLIDGARVYNHDAAVGFLSTLTIASANINHRLTITTKNKLAFVLVSGAEATQRPCRIEGKTLLGKGQTQLNCLGGANITVAKDEYKTADTILLEKGKVVGKIPFEKGCLVFLYKGAHVGHLATVEDVQNRNVLLKADDGKSFQTRRHYCFVVGKGKPSISVKA